MRRIAAATFALLLALAAPAAAAECDGTLSGKVTASFACDVTAFTSDQGVPVLVIHGRAPIEGVPSYVPGAFELPDPVRPGTYTLAELGMGKASVAADGGALYVASKTTGQRGEVTLVLRTVKQNPAEKGTWTVHGTYRARLVPAGAGKEGEVVVEVKF